MSRPTAASYLDGLDLSRGAKEKWLKNLADERGGRRKDLTTTGSMSFNQALAENERSAPALSHYPDPQKDIPWLAHHVYGKGADIIWRTGIIRVDSFSSIAETLGMSPEDSAIYEEETRLDFHGKPLAQSVAHLVGNVMASGPDPKMIKADIAMASYDRWLDRSNPGAIAEFKRALGGTCGGQGVDEEARVTFTRLTSGAYPPLLKGGVAPKVMDLDGSHPMHGGTLHPSQGREDLSAALAGRLPL